MLSGGGGNTHQTLQTDQMCQIWESLLCWNTNKQKLQGFHQRRFKIKDVIHVSRNRTSVFVLPVSSARWEKNSESGLLFVFCFSLCHRHEWMREPGRWLWKDRRGKHCFLMIITLNVNIFTLNVYSHYKISPKRLFVRPTHSEKVQDYPAFLKNNFLISRPKKSFNHLSATMGTRWSTWFWMIARSLMIILAGEVKGEFVKELKMNFDLSRGCLNFFSSLSTAAIFCRASAPPVHALRLTEDDICFERLYFNELLYDTKLWGTSWQSLTWVCFGTDLVLQHYYHHSICLDAFAWEKFVFFSRHAAINFRVIFLFVWLFELCFCFCSIENKRGFLFLLNTQVPSWGEKSSTALFIFIGY